MGTTIAAVATALAALAGLVLYLVKRADSPARQYAEAQRRCDEAFAAWQRATQEMQDELDKESVDLERVRTVLEPAMLRAHRLYHDAQAARAALRP
jgi:hypothetical protein